MSKLNLGCGQEFIEDATNLDVAPLIYVLDDTGNVKGTRKPDVVWDLNKLPWPFKNEQFDLVVARAVLEHLDIDLARSLNECWRILKVGGIVSLKLPYWDCDISYWDVTHRWFFSLRSFDQFDPDTSRGKLYRHYTPFKWKIIRPAQLNKAQSSIHVDMQKRASEGAK